MTYQKLYGIMDDGIGRRTTHSRHGKVEKITGSINTHRGEAFNFRVRADDDSIKVFIELENIAVDGSLMTDALYDLVKNNNGRFTFEYEITKPIITAQEFKTGER